MKEIFKKYIFPVAMLSSSIIGVGFWSLPYIALKSGIFLTIFYLVVLTAIAAIINSIVGEIALKTPDYKRLPGFVEFHLGKRAKLISLATTIFGGLGVLLVYLIVGGEFLTSALSPFFGGSYLFYVLIYFVLAAAVLYFDVKTIAKIEFGAIILLLLTLIIIFITGLSHIKISNLFISDFGFRASIFFLPYGPIIFSLWGVGLIPEAEEMVKGNKKNIKKIIIISALIPSVIYFLFIILVLGITGSGTTESALTGLKGALGGWVPYFALSVGAFITFNAFISLGLILKKVLMYDLKIKSWHAIIIVCFIPLILFLMGFRSFIPIISLIGGIFIGIDGILILLMYKKIGGKKVLIYPLSLVFLLGAVYEIIYFVK